MAKIEGSKFTVGMQVMIIGLLYNDVRQDVGGVVQGRPRGRPGTTILDVSVNGTIIQVDESKLIPWGLYWALKS